jgi:hypothetical protein
MMPYRGLRQVLYFTFSLSAVVGGFVFLSQILAGRDLETAIPNFALQTGLAVLMIWLFRREGQAKQQTIQRIQKSLNSNSESRKNSCKTDE